MSSLNQQECWGLFAPTTRYQNDKEYMYMSWVLCDQARRNFCFFVFYFFFGWILDTFSHVIIYRIYHILSTQNQSICNRRERWISRVRFSFRSVQIVFFSLFSYFLGSIIWKTHTQTHTIGPIQRVGKLLAVVVVVVVVVDYIFFFFSQ